MRINIISADKNEYAIYYYKADDKMFGNWGKSEHIVGDEKAKLLDKIRVWQEKENKFRKQYNLPQYIW